MGRKPLGQLPIGRFSTVIDALIIKENTAQNKPLSSGSMPNFAPPFCAIGQSRYDHFIGTAIHLYLIKPRQLIAVRTHLPFFFFWQNRYCKTIPFPVVMPISWMSHSAMPISDMVHSQAHTNTSIHKKRKSNDLRFLVAAPVRLELTTLGLTVRCSTD